MEESMEVTTEEVTSVAMETTTRENLQATAGALAEVIQLHRSPPLLTPPLLIQTLLLRNLLHHTALLDHLLKLVLLHMKRKDIHIPKQLPHTMPMHLRTNRKVLRTPNQLPHTEPVLPRILDPLLPMTRIPNHPLLTKAEFLHMNLTPVLLTVMLLLLTVVLLLLTVALPPLTGDQLIRTKV